jgi:hypothetical protein
MVIEVNSSPGFIIEKVNDFNLAKLIVRQAVNNANRQERQAMKKLAAKLNEPITIPKPIKKNLRPMPAALRRLRIRPKA